MFDYIPTAKKDFSITLPVLVQTLKLKKYKYKALW